MSARSTRSRGWRAPCKKRFGGTDILMNNAGIGPESNSFGLLENWQRILAVNLWGVIYGTQVFAPRMIERGRPGLIINTGSKQGITTPPGNPAYNVSKAGVKALTEALQHELRGKDGCKISAHLMILGSCLHWPDIARPHRQTGRRLDAGTNRRLHDRTHRRRRLLHPAPGQRRAASVSTSGGSCGRRAISWRTGPRCRGGIRIMPRPLPSL